MKLSSGNRLDPPCNFLLCLLQMLDFLKTRFRRGQQRGGGLNGYNPRLQPASALNTSNVQIVHLVGCFLTALSPAVESAHFLSPDLPKSLGKFVSFCVLY